MRRERRARVLLTTTSHLRRLGLVDPIWFLFPTGPVFGFAPGAGLGKLQGIGETAMRHVLTS